MKKIALLISTITIISSGFSQPDNTKAATIKAQIIALEKAGWQAWKNNDPTWFKNNTTEECIWINADGITNKKQMIASTPVDCKVKMVSIDDFRFEMLNQNAVLLTYLALQDGTCGDKKLTEKIRVSVNYVKRGGKWLEAFYMETPLAQ